MDSITQALRPRMHCLICRTKNRQVVCKICLESLPRLTHTCLQCALPLSVPSDQICGHCIQNPPALDRVLTAYAYTSPLRFLIHQFKYHEGYFLTTTLSSLLLNALPQYYQTDCIIPVPMHTRRLRERGFDHTLWLARAVSQHTGIPIRADLCQKVQHTLNSAQLNAKERRKNTPQAYSVAASPYQHITLLDDLFTTGETSNTIARLLKETGVREVNLWCCARTLIDKTMR
jgi:ComF family protein